MRNPEPAPLGRLLQEAAAVACPTCYDCLPLVAIPPHVLTPQASRMVGVLTRGGG